MEIINQAEEWWYEEDGKRLGPVSRDEIQNMVNNSVLNRNTNVWRNGFQDWKNITSTDFALNTSQPPPLLADSINNTFLWLLAFAPLIGLVVEYLIAMAIIDNEDKAIGMVDDGKFWMVTLVINILFAWLDEKQVNKAGHDTSKFKGWIWIVPVYIFVRSKNTKVSYAAFIIWIIAFLILLGG